MTSRRVLAAIMLAGAALLLDGVPALAQARSVGSAALWRGREAVTEREMEQRQQQNEIDAGRRAGIDKGMDWLSLGIDIANASRDFGESFSPLNPDDQRFDPDYNPPGNPDVPISCGEDAACQSCYARAQRNVNFVRVQFEKLRAIYDSTTRMADTAIAFGDNVSGIHGALGLAWQAERVGIQKSVDSLGKTYDGKYADLLGSLKRSLDEISECESKHFNTPDWYNRFGFIYYEFMAARYSRK
ncbi:MAG TPA: hypothetical protein VGD94_21680 [Vicinamibacterales bacterium]